MTRLRRWLQRQRCKFYVGTCELCAPGGTVSGSNICAACTEGDCDSCSGGKCTCCGDGDRRQP